MSTKKSLLVFKPIYNEYKRKTTLNVNQSMKDKRTPNLNVLSNADTIA